MFGFYPFADIKLRLFYFCISTVLFNIILCYRVYLHFQHFFNKVKFVQYISPHTPTPPIHLPKAPNFPITTQLHIHHNPISNNPHFTPYNSPYRHAKQQVHNRPNIYHTTISTSTHKTSHKTAYIVQ